MSLHKSFKLDKSREKRTILTRAERVENLLKQGKPLQIFGLPKEKIKRMKLIKETKKENGTDKT